MSREARWASSVLPPSCLEIGCVLAQYEIQRFREHQRSLATDRLAAAFEQQPPARLALWPTRAARGREGRRRARSTQPHGAATFPAFFRKAPHLPMPSAPAPPQGIGLRYFSDLPRIQLVSPTLRATAAKRTLVRDAAPATQELRDARSGPQVSDRPHRHRHTRRDGGRPFRVPAGLALVEGCRTDRRHRLLPAPPRRLHRLGLPRGTHGRRNENGHRTRRSLRDPARPRRLGARRGTVGLRRVYKRTCLRTVARGAR